MTTPEPRHLAAEILPATFLSKSALAARGASRHRVSQWVRDGRLVRLRNGRYAHSDLHPDLVRAGTLGARLDCVSLLRDLGVFVHTPRGLHVQIDKGASRLPPAPDGVVRHWRESSCDRDRLAADLVEAIAQAFRCQEPRYAIATLDSAWHHRLIDEAQVDAVFARLPRRYRRLRGLADRLAESGSETIMRLMLRGLGCHVEAQVDIPGVGRVDFVVDGWLIVECDSRAHHEGWAARKRDLRRDLAAAALGYTTVRPIAEDILYRREEVVASMKAILSSPAPRPGLQNSFDSIGRMLERV